MNNLLNANVPMPPWLRRIQQMWLWQALGLPICIGFLGSLLLYGCFSVGIFHMQKDCIEKAITGLIISMVTAITVGHSPNSSDFHVDGNPNDIVTQVADQTKTMSPEVAKTAMAAVSVNMPLADELKKQEENKG